ncbi:TerB family tellurite resistance protein [Psychromonas sp.]|nr:TerB family tellurite resistance protein [Psychromonas sp.]
MSLLMTIFISLCGIFAGLFEGHKYKQRRIKHTIVRGVQKQNKEKQQIQYKKITKLDKYFSEALIKSRVEQAFFIVKNAYSSHDIRSAIPFISDGLAESLHILFQIQTHRNRQRKIENLHLNTCELVGMEADKHFETLHFKLNSSASYLIVDKSNDNKNINTSTPLKQHTEYWTFVRLPGTQTRNTPGLIEGYCPNCGNRLTLSQFSQCESCQSLVGSGEYDWILAKITSESQWRFQNAKRQIPGVSDYQVVDPAFNIPLIEDRVTSIFWRLQKAWLTQQVDPLLSVAHPEFIDEFKQQHLKQFCFDNIHLGLCEVSHVKFGIEFDQVHLLVKWQANKIDLTSNQMSENGFYAHHITLIRKTGLTSNIKKGLQSLHCFGCGSPQSSNYQDCCEYCGNRLNSGEQGWILKRLSPHLEHIIEMKGQEFVVDNQPFNKSDRIFDPVSLLSCLVLVLFADGKIDPAEKKCLDEFVKNRRIPEKILDDIMHAAQAGHLDMPMPDETLDASDWLNKLIEMCLADGEVCSQEKKLLLAFGAKFNILAIDINLRIKQTRKKMYLQHKETLKNQLKKQIKA